MRMIKDFLEYVIHVIFIFIMCLAILYPLTINMKDNPWWWSAWFIYPATLLIIIHIERNKQAYVNKTYKMFK